MLCFSVFRMLVDVMLCKYTRPTLKMYSAWNFFFNDDTRHLLLLKRSLIYMTIIIIIIANYSLSVHYRAMLL